MKTKIKKKAKPKARRINGVKQEFELLSFCKEFRDLKLSDKNSKIVDAVCLDEGVKGWDLSKLKRGLRLIVIASKGKIKSVGGKIAITNVMNILHPVQMDIEDLLKEKSGV